MYRTLTLILLLMTSADSAVSQGVELQVYPAGFIGAVSWTLSDSETSNFRLYAGYNTTNRQDWGEHDEERGAGPGFGADVLWFAFNRIPQLWVGARADVWMLTIDWRQDTPFSSGSSDVLVLQPTVRTGYRVFSDHLNVDLTLSMGAEVNVRTSGEDVGQGPILLAGIRVTY